MVNNTVNGKKIGKVAGSQNRAKIVATAIQQDRQKELEAQGKINISTVDLIHAGEFISIKAYPGGNPNKNKDNELTH